MRSASSSAGSCRMYSPFIHVSLSALKMAPDFPTRSRSKCCTSSSREKTSVWSSSDHPRSAMKFVSASGRYPSSRYASVDVAPCLFDSLERSGPRIIGRCANTGGVHSSDRYSST